MEKRKIRVFEAFAGYGSQAVALKRLAAARPELDFEFVGISEISKPATMAYSLLHGDVPDFGDITKIAWEDVPDFDLFTWSFPCQDISVAGKQRGAAQGSGTRSALGWHAVEAIEKKRPKYALMENVKAFVGAKNRAVFCEMMDRLRAAGYANFWQVMDAADYGVPQHRERVFMVSILRTADDPSPAYQFPKPFPLEMRLKDVLLPYGSVPESYYLPQEKVDRILEQKRQSGKLRAEQAPTLFGEDFLQAVGASSTSATSTAATPTEATAATSSTPPASADASTPQSPSGQDSLTS